MVLDGTTGLNMLQQAREFNEVFASSNYPFLFSRSLCSNIFLAVNRFHNFVDIWFYILLQVVGVTGFILTKLDGSARGGCVVSAAKPLVVLCSVS
jgi:fused signal recognition particle receptor